MDDREEKLLNLALDPAASEGEIANAGRMLINLWRKAGKKAADVQIKTVYITKIITNTVHVDHNKRPSMLMPFGAHKGTPIMELPITYLYWLADLPNLSKALKSEVDRVLALDLA